MPPAVTPHNWLPAQQLRRALLQEVEHAGLEAECTGRDAIRMLHERGKL
jgi:hypothetical protein